MNSPKKVGNICMLILGVIGFIILCNTFIQADSRMGVEQNGWLWFWILLVSPIAAIVSFVLRGSNQTIAKWSMGVNLFLVAVLPVMAVIGLIGAIFTT